MQVVKIMPCLDMKDGRVVKGVKFNNLRDAGDPVENAKFYECEGADELAILDISATVEGRKTRQKWVKDVLSVINIPLTVGGGISTLSDMAELFELGVSKIGINTAAVNEPNLIAEGFSFVFLSLNLPVSESQQTLSCIFTKSNYSKWF